MSTTSENNVFLDYLVTLPNEELLHLHKESSTALFIFRLLPGIAQQVIVKLIWNSNVKELLKHEKLAQQFTVCISLLQRLNMVYTSGDDVLINSDFRRSYLRSVMLGAHRCANLSQAESEDKKKTKDIPKKSAERWECILKYLALPSEQNMSSVSVETRQLFHSAAFTSGDGRDIEITSMGFQFLLLDPVQQMWTYIREYFKMERDKGTNILELIELLVRIILCVDKGSDPAKSCYVLNEEWTSKQIEMVLHLRELGLIFIRKRKDGFFFLTPLLWNLTAGREPESREERRSGNTIVETNFRLYAYTDSSLQLAILSTFTEMTYRFNDMCVGMLTRESVRRALQVGITASQIISFLRTNAHNQCVASRGPFNCLPITVADQIRLWEDERKRLNMVDAVLYTAFENEKEYTDVRDFTSAEKILQYADNNQQLVIVTEEGHNLVKQWWREHRTTPKQMSLPAQDDERHLFEHFVIAGLDYNASEQLLPPLQECGCRNIQPLAPITDLVVIFPSLGETMPEGFEMISTTPLGYPADLNHGSIRMPSVFLGYRRGYHKPPLIDIGVLDEGRGEKPMVDTNILKTTPFGRQANVNNASQSIYLTYRRAAPNSAPSQFVVTDICVIMANKGEIPPHTYYKIPKNLNRGMVGWDVYLCYKKSQGTSKRLAYKPTVLDYFPKPHNKEEDFRLAQNIPLFCLPMGALIECWPVKCQPPDKSFTTFVLTDEDGTKFYGAAVSFYERYPHKLTDEQLEKLDLLPKEEGGAVEDSSSNNDPADDVEFHTNLAICLISRYPFFQSFKRFLYFIHRLSQGAGISNIPIERYLSHLRYEVSFPTPKRPRVLMTLAAETICFESHDDSQLPLNGAQHFETLKALGPDNLMYLMLLALLEQKILIHSLRSWMLTAVAESICSLMFPFHWQCPYIPQCPLGLAGVLHAPLPFIAGVDSRYFELYEDPPEDVTCFDLDTSTISASSVRHIFKLSIFPKKAIKQLRSTLEDLFRKLSVQNFEQTTSQKINEFIPVDKEMQWQKQKREIEVAIQEAFLRFMCQLMSGYQSFLRPIKSAPSCAKATDTGNLFDLGGFFRSRDKSGTEFFKRFCETQSFMRFIEERSFISDKNAYNAFFDDCALKVALSENASEVSLLELDSSSSDKNPSVFIAPPEPLVNFETNKEREFKYHGFPRKLNPDLFQLDQLIYNSSDFQKVPIEHDCSRCAAVRTKPEIRSSYMGAVNAVRSNQMHYPKTLLFYAYSLWFMQLPSLLAVAPNKRKIIMLAFNVLDRLEQSGVVLYDQVCYRIVIQLCGECGMPELAVKVLQAMQRAGLEQNAVTYGIYHRAVMGAEWPSQARQNAIKAWNKLRSVVVGASRFKSGFHFERPSSSQTSSDSISCNSVSIKEYATHTISVGPLNEDALSKTGEDRRAQTPSDYNVADDPLGALAHSEKMKSAESRTTMSPSRAKFLAEHSLQPYASELGTQFENKPKSSSWLKGIANSPLMKIIRNQTFESPKTLDAHSDASSITGSPSIQSLVTQVEASSLKSTKKRLRKLRLGLSKTFPGVSSKLRSGMSSLVQEVRKSYGPLGSGGMFNSETETSGFDLNERAYQLDTGNTGTLLSESWWMSEVQQQMRREQSREQMSNPAQPCTTFDSLVEVTLSTCTPCPVCRRMIYDEEIMAGWKVEDQNLNTVCPYCVAENPVDTKNYEFVPQLSIKFSSETSPRSSWYSPGGISSESPTVDNELPESFSVAFVSPIVLRRELETWLMADMKSLKEASVKDTHPVIFWNLVYYLRRLGLPTHLFSWISNRYQIRCVFDRPSQHLDAAPLYFLNPNNDGLYHSTAQLRSIDVWKSVTQAVQDNKLFAAMQALINDSRKIMNGGQIVIGSHFPIFRDIQFASLDLFGRALVRDNLDVQYPSDWNRLPVRIRSLLPSHDHPQSPIHRACRKIFLPLDLV